MIVPLFRGSSRFESLISPHHSRFNVACECKKKEIHDDGVMEGRGGDLHAIQVIGLEVEGEGVAFFLWGAVAPVVVQICHVLRGGEHAVYVHLKGSSELRAMHR